MYICPNCNYSTEEQSNYCPVCGSQVVEVQPQPQPQPVYQQPDLYAQQYQAYNQYYQPQPAAQVSKGKIIVSMILSIVGLAFAGLGLLYTFVGLATGGVGVALAMAVVFGIFSVPLSIVGLILSTSCIRAGAQSGMVKVGKILGLIGVIASGVMLLLGLMSLGFEDYGYDYF